MECIQINLSHLTSIKNLFGPEIPQSSPEIEFSTRFVDGSLTLAILRSQMDNPNTQLPSQAILLDEINLASPQVLELLEFYILNMNKSSRYFLPNGKSISHNTIVIISTLTSSSLYNSFSSLSTKLQDVSHFLGLIPFNEYKLEAFAKSIFSERDDSHLSSSFLKKL
jgi:hypothetical protein